MEVSKNGESEEISLWPSWHWQLLSLSDLMAPLEIADFEVNRRLILAILLSSLQQVLIHASIDSNILNLYAVSMNSTSLLQFITNITFHF